MDWNIRFNNLYDALHSSASAPRSVYSKVGDWTEDFTTITVIILCLDTIKPNSGASNARAHEFIDFCEQSNEQQSEAFFKCLHSLAFALSSDTEQSIITETLHEIDQIKGRIQVFNNYEFQIITYLLRARLDTSNLSKTKSDQWVVKIQSKIDEYLEANDTLTPYSKFLQQLKYSIYTLQLARYQQLNKWSSYLTSSYQLLNEGLLDLSPANRLLLQWYRENSDLSALLPFFTKSLLMEPYGYFKSTISQRMQFYFTHTDQTPVAEQLDPQSTITKILKHLAYERFFFLSTSSDSEQILSYIRGQLCADEGQFQTIYNNLIDSNIIFASRKFSSVKLSTLITLFRIEEKGYSSSSLIDAVFKLSRDKKLVVRIDQCDDILTFPLLRKGDSVSLDTVFAHALPQALERDWDKLMLSS